jgi:hypothetical protein
MQRRCVLLDEIVTDAVPVGDGPYSCVTGRHEGATVEE